jgi:hypothetical protein
MSIGVLGPLYFAISYLSTPSSTLSSPSFLRTSPSYIVAILPAVLTGYLSSHIPSFFHPDLQTRHTANWVWQLYPLWGSISLYSIAWVIRQLPPAWIISHVNTPKGRLNTIRAIAAFFSILSTGTYWYALVSTSTSFSTSTSVREIFLPEYLLQPPPAADIALRTIFQYDYLCCYSAAFLWLTYSFHEIHRSSLAPVPWAKIWAGFIVGTPCLGVGTTLMMGWIAREEILAASTGTGRSKKMR